MILDMDMIIRTNRRKRVLDLTAVTLSSPLWGPLGVATALAVRISMGRPVLYKQARAGLHGTKFSVLKFRTMTNQTDAGGSLLSDQERLTRVGTLLRKLSLDELPQLLNVLRGSMALVGPRPLYLHYLPYYTPGESRRHLVRPGITGLAQVSGRNAVAWDERLGLDARYVTGLSLRQDFKILTLTVGQVLAGSGVSVVANDSGEPLDVVRSYPVHNVLSMRRFEFRDIPDKVRLFTHPIIRRHMQLPSDVTIEGTQTWLKQVRSSSDYYDFTFYHRETAQFVGLAGLRARDASRSPELYILIDPEHQGRGMGKAALTILIDWMRSRSEFDGCWLSVSADNAPALNLYRRVGFVERGRTVMGAGSGRIEMELTWA